MDDDPRYNEAAQNLARWRSGLEAIFKDRARFVERYILSLALEPPRRVQTPSRRPAAPPPTSSPAPGGVTDPGDEDGR
ncbi:MAG: hypothetical protein KC609_24865 [Myxococcales bacterium]|nr:hypothetical protein [Myxococcales bacterium]